MVVGGLTRCKHIVVLDDCGLAMGCLRAYRKLSVASIRYPCMNVVGESQLSTSLVLLLWELS